MEETDVGRMLAAVAPDTVPAAGDLPERVRALGKRRRARRAFVTSGGATIAVVGVFGAVAAFGGFGGGSGQQSSAEFISNTNTTPAPAPSTSPAAAVPTTPATPTTPTTPTTKHSFPPPIQDPVADAKVTTAVKAALPAGDAAGLTLYRAAATAGKGPGGGYGAEFNWGPRSSEEVFSASVGPYNPSVHGTPTMCADDPHHCTSGTATLQGHQVRWEYYYGDQRSPSFNVYDDQAGINYLITTTGPNPSALPGLAEIKSVALNEQVAAALMAAWPQH